jgi:hypothetical protein
MGHCIPKLLLYEQPDCSETESSISVGDGMNGVFRATIKDACLGCDELMNEKSSCDPPSGKGEAKKFGSGELWLRPFMIVAEL